MFKNLSLPIKISIVFFPLFFAAVALIVYFNYSGQQEQMMAQVQNAATAQAGTIREALVNMMVTNEQVDDSYLKKISESGDIKQIRILFRLDSLRLADDYLEDSARVYRLAKREVETWDLHREYMPIVFATTTPRWFLTCRKNLHPAHEMNNLSTDRPTILHECEEMEALIPFVAEKKCQRCHNVEKGSVLGSAVMTVPLEKASLDLQKNFLRSLFIFLGFIVISLVLNALLFRKFVNRPLKKLIYVTEEIGKGNSVDTTISAEFDRDEFGKLAASFKTMQTNLQKIQDELMQKERLSTLGQMASSVVHDFRTPMSNVSIAIDYLQRHRDAPTEKQNEMYGMIKTAMQRMNRMMRELLDFSKGEFQLEYSECTIEECAEALRKEYTARFLSSKIEFLLSTHAHGAITVDKESIIRAIENLINNAEDAMPEGGTLTVTILPGASKENIKISIKDTGKGIPADVQTTLFEPFVTSGKRHGTGLGLAITKRIIDLHGGTIIFTSELEKGTEFILTIPRQP